LIGSDGSQYGVVSLLKAIETARTEGLDLVEVSPKADPPVCKILDYGQWIYTQSKQKQKAKAKSHRQEIKGIRLTYNMGTHDIAVRVKQAEKFLSLGHRLKTEIILKGRQKAHPEKVKENLIKFQELLGDKIKIEQPPKREGNKFSAVYSAKK